MIETMISCPKCGGVLSFVSGPIDEECRIPDFMYCFNEDCNNKDGYDPCSILTGKFEVVVKLGGE